MIKGIQIISITVMICCCFLLCLPSVTSAKYVKVSSSDNIINLEIYENGQVITEIKNDGTTPDVEVSQGVSASDVYDYGVVYGFAEGDSPKNYTKLKVSAEFRFKKNYLADLDTARVYDAYATFGKLPPMYMGVFDDKDNLLGVSSNQIIVRKKSNNNVIHSGSVNEVIVDVSSITQNLTSADSLVLSVQIVRQEGNTYVPYGIHKVNLVGDVLISDYLEVYNYEVFLLS